MRTREFHVRIRVCESDCRRAQVRSTNCTRVHPLSTRVHHSTARVERLKPTATCANTLNTRRLIRVGSREAKAAVIIHWTRTPLAAELYEASRGSLENRCSAGALVQCVMHCNAERPESSGRDSGREDTGNGHVASRSRQQCVRAHHESSLRQASPIACRCR